MKPIIFSTEMVRAILDGRKTQTRRVMKPQPKFEGNDVWNYKGEFFVTDESMQSHLFHDVYGNNGSPYGSAYPNGGDKLWVRETWGAYRFEAVDGSLEYPNVLYKADSTTKLFIGGLVWKYYQEDKFRWRPSIHMPKAFSRITLEIKDVRVERVQDIKPKDCSKEGMSGFSGMVLANTAMLITGTNSLAEAQNVALHDEFVHLWDSINLKRGYGWDTNPWVWVVEFEEKK